MTIQQEDKEKVISNMYTYAEVLMNEDGKSAKEIKQILLNQGYDEESVSVVMARLGQQSRNSNKEEANKDILWGAIWCIGGIVATVADIGYIFWGAIVFGGIQLIKGIANYL